MKTQEEYIKRAEKALRSSELAESWEAGMVYAQQAVALVGLAQLAPTARIVVVPTMREEV